MSDKSRFITLGVVVLVFLAANIIAGIYRWGAPRETQVRQEMTEEIAEDIGKLEKQQSKAGSELGELKEPEATAKKTVSGETGAAPVNSELQAKIKSLKEENTYLLSNQQTANDLATQNTQLKEKLQALLETKQTLEKENDQLRSADLKSREIAAKQSRLQEQIASYKNEISALKNEISVLRAELQDKRNRAAENQQMQAKLEAANKEIEALKERLEKIRVMVTGEKNSSQ